MIERLGRAGHQVELVSGVDLDASKLENAIQRHAHKALYVVCRSDELDVYQVARLSEVFDEQHVSRQAVLMVDFEPGKAAGIVEPVLSNAGAAVQSSGAPSDMQERDDRDERLPSFGIPWWKVAVAGAAGIGVGGLALLLTCGPSDDAVPSLDDQDESAVAAASVVPESKADDPDHEPETKPNAIAAPAAEPEALAQGGEDPAPDAEPEVAVEPDDEEPVVEEQPVPAADLTGGGLDAESDIDTPVEDQEAAIAAALKARKIRALDILLVQRFPTKRMNYASGKAFCEELNIDGVTLWRLPTIGEINSLTSASVVKKDQYWTINKADTFGDAMLVWSAKRKRISPRKTRWRGARTACVRTRDGGPPDEQTSGIPG